MLSIEEAAAKLNHATKDNSIFYITNDAERALGLENVLENYHIVCIDHNYIYQQLKCNHIKCFCLEEEENTQNIIYRNSYKLLSLNKTQEYIKNNSKSNTNVEFFKIAPNLEFLSKKMNFNILNTTSELNKKFENKINQWEEFRNCGVRLPKIKIGLLKDFNYELLKKEFTDFVVQFDRGQSGNSTYFIKDIEEFCNLQKLFPIRTSKIAEKINGIYFTINGCVTRHGTAIGGLCNQITGVPELTSNEGGTCGNDWTQIDLDKKAKEQIIEYSLKVGDMMKINGFIGLFGIDYVVDENNLVYLLEVNARSSASIPAFTKLQLQNKILPLSLLHLLEFFKLEYKINLEELNKQSVESMYYSQIVFKNIQKTSLKVNEILNGGVFDLKKLDKVRDEYDISKIENNEMLVIPANKNREINENMEYLRIQFPFRAVDSKNKLLAPINKLVNEIKQNISLV